MSWFDRIGDAFSKAKSEASIGLAWWTAQQSRYEAKDNPDFLQRFNRWVDAKAVGPVSDAVTSGVTHVADTAGQIISDYVSRPLSSIYQMAATGDFSAQAAVQGYNRAEEISPGQAFTIGTRTDGYLRSKGIDPNDPFSPANSGARKDWLENTWSGKLQSGSVDFALSYVLDPFAAAGKGVKAASTASRTLKGAEETSAALKASSYADPIYSAGQVADMAGVSGREARLGKKIDTFLRKTDKMSASEIALQPEMRATADGGALAYFFDRANQVENINDRLKLKRTLWGAVLGDKDSISVLEANHAKLADELAKMNQVPAQARFIAESNGDIRLIGQELAKRNADQATLDEIEGRRKEISDTLAHMERVIQAKGSSSLVKGDARQQLATDTAMADLSKDLRVVTIGDGLAARRTRVISGAVGARLPGHVSVKDPSAGYEQLRETLSQAVHMDPEIRKELLDQYVKAGTAGDRIGVVSRAEAHIVKSIANKYGLTPEQARRMMADGNVRRDGYRNLLKARLYSAAVDDDHVAIFDPESDEIYAISRPLLKSQIEEHAPIIDPRMLDKQVKWATQNRVMDSVFRHRPGGDTFVDYVDDRVDVMNDLLTRFTGAWKFGALFRFAYPMRVQVDSQMRLAAYMGILPYAAQFPKVMGSLGKYLVQGAKRDWYEEDGKKIFNWVNPEFQDRISRDLIKKLTKDDPEGWALTDDELKIVSRTLLDNDGGIADLAQELADRNLKKGRSNGNWGYVDAEDPNWGNAYVRAVNQQIRNSPTAMAFVQGADTAQIRTLMTKNAAMRKEWAEMRGLYDNDLDAWAATVKAHVEYYLPTAEVRSTLLRREFTRSDVKRYFGSSTIEPGKPFKGRGDRTSRSNAPWITKGPGADGDVGDGMRLRPMKIHGEAYSPVTKSAFEDWYERTRRQWFSFASSAPENVMARSPLYAYAFKRHMEDIVSRLDDSSYIDLDQARRTADKLARKDVGSVLFDVSHASNMSHAWRFVSPFFAAWEDMAQKWTGLIYDKPWVAERMRQAWEAPNNMGIVQDSEGNRVNADGTKWSKGPDGKWRQLDPVKDAALIGKGEYLVIPSALVPFKDSTGAGNLRLNKKGFNIVFQGEPWWLPGAGPLVQVPVNELARRSFPDLVDNPALKFLLPYGVTDESPRRQLMPSWARQAETALFKNTNDYGETYKLLWAQEQSRVTAGERGEIKPGEIEQMARNWYLMRAFVSNASPVSAMPSPKLQFYIDKSHEYRDQYGEDKWQEQFMKDFPDYYRMTLSLNSNESGIQATDNAWRALGDPKIRQAISEDPSNGWALLGADAFIRPDTPGAQYDSNVATALKTAQYGYGNTDTFRTAKNPAEALADNQRQEGWLRYSKVMTLVNLELEKRGLHSLSQRGAEDLKFARDAYVEALAGENQIWFQDYQDGSQKKLPQFLATMQKAKEGNSNFANRSDVKALDRYLAIRREAQKILASRDTKDINHPDNKDVKSALDAYGAALASEDFGFEQMWNRLLERDDLKGEY